MLNHDAATALQQLLKGMGVRGSRVLNEPRQVACGAPDPVVEHDGVAIGHVASTDITIPLDQAAATGPLARYRHGLANVILANHPEFRWYREGQQWGKCAWDIRIAMAPSGSSGGV